MLIESSQKSQIAWIINQYASHPDVGMGGRHYYLARELVCKGYEVHIISSGRHHLLRDRIKIPGLVKHEKVSGINYHWVKLPRYKSSHSGLRVLCWFLFPFLVLLSIFNIKKAPSVILYSSPSLPGFLAAEYLARKNKAKLIFEIRDIWPLTLIKLGGISVQHPLISLFSWLEKRAYTKSDVVVSNLRGAILHIKTVVPNHVVFNWLPNGFSRSEMDNCKPLSKNVKNKLPKGHFIVGYAGSIGVANAIDTLFEAAVKLRMDTHVSFVIVGSGEERDNLEQRAIELELSNVVFVDPVPKEQIASLLQCFDVNYIGWNDESIYKYGIGANKIPEYMYSGKPILHSFSGCFDPIQESGAGITVPANDSNKLARAILEFWQMSQNDRDIMGQRGKVAALKYYEYGQIAEGFERVLFHV